MTADEQLRFDIESHLTSDPSLDETGILVAVKAGVVTLGGHVPSWREREDAATTAWSAPAVTRVDNDLVLAVRAGK